MSLSNSLKEHHGLPLSFMRHIYFRILSMQVATVPSYHIFLIHLLIHFPHYNEIMDTTDIKFAKDMLQHLWTGPISNASVEVAQGGQFVEVQRKER